jgi:branched-chain amino acid transport system substrate-binding protein
MFPGFEMEGRTFGQYILKHKPNAKIAVLYQNDDYGKDFLTGLKSALGDMNTPVAEISYEITAPTIDSEIVRLKDAGADAVFYFATPKFAAQGLRKVKEMGWTPLQFLVSPSNSVKAVIEPAGFDNAQGVITTQFTKQAGDPRWEKDPEVIEYVAFMKKWVPNDNPSDFAEFRGLQFMLADMAMHIEAAHSLVCDCAGIADDGFASDADFRAFSAKASMAKCFASDMAMKVTTDAVQIFGGAG